MKNEPFEHRIRRQPFRSLPESWKAEILGQAGQAAAEGVSAQPACRAQALSWHRIWRDWLWPHPVAWAGLIALWLGLASLNWITGERPTRPPRTVLPASAGEMLILQEQQRRWADLVAAWRSGSPVATRPDAHHKSKPRSQSYEHLILRIG